MCPGLCNQGQPLTSNPPVCTSSVAGVHHQTWFYAVLVIKLKVFCILSKHSTNCAASPAPFFFLNLPFRIRNSPLGTIFPTAHQFWNVNLLFSLDFSGMYVYVCMFVLCTPVCTHVYLCTQPCVHVCWVHGCVYGWMDLCCICMYARMCI